MKDCFVLILIKTKTYITSWAFMHGNYKWKKEARLKRKNIKVQQKSTSFSTIFLLVCVQYMYTFLFSWVIIYIIELHARNEDDPWNLQRKMTIHGFDFLNVRPSPPPEKNLDPRFTMRRKAIIINDINVLFINFKCMKIYTAMQQNVSWVKNAYHFLLL